MKRKILTLLKQWKNKKDRKPLILKGVRQVGKTYVLKEFGSTCFPKYHYVNFEKEPALESLFQQNLDPKRIINELSFHLDTTINIQQDLIIFDEIQACPKALTSLKYFQEEMPELALCAAGSLLGIHLNSESFPVGKTDFMNLYPMDFEEFLLAMDDEKSVNFLDNISLNSTIPELIHQHLWGQLKEYLIVGGLPEVVSVFRENKQNLFDAFQKVRSKQEALVSAYYADIAKHSGKVNAMHIDRVWQDVPHQLARSQDDSVRKFKFQGIIPGINRYSRLVNVIDWLEGAGLVIKVQVAHSAQLPLAAYTKENAFKLFLFDIGILGAMSNLSPKTIFEHNYGTYKGYFVENFVAQEFLATVQKQLYSWQEGTDEIEFLREIDGAILPIEVKSGIVTKVKSLKVFAKKYSPLYLTIMSANNLYVDPVIGIYRYPLYLAGKFPLRN